MKFGICCAPNALGEPQRLFDLLLDAGADYFDWAVGSLMASEAEFEKLRSLLEKTPLKPEAYMGFLPPHHRITGPNVNLPAVLEYADEVMRRAKALGGEIIVLGSGSARKVPEGFDFDVAHQQFTQFCRELAPYAQERGIIIAIEPLNSREDNLITTVAKGQEHVDAVNHPNIQLLADFYHMVEDNEPLENVEKAGARLKHTHLADLGRVAPGYAKEGEADFIGFFKALRVAGYDSRCSFEGKMEDLSRQAKPTLATMRDRYAQSAS